MTDQKFQNLYKQIVEGLRNSEELLFLHISFLRIFLLAKGKEDVHQINYPVKLHIRTFFETVIGLSQLVRSVFQGLFGKKAEALILVIEPTHFKQVQGMAPYLFRYKPIFITTKKAYLHTLRQTFSTSRVIFLPTFFINPKKVKAGTLKELFNQNEIPVKDEVISFATQIANDQVNNYRYIRFALGILVRFHRLKFALVFNDLTTTGRIITTILNKTSCKTCYVMHGLLSDEFIETLHIADQFFIFGDYTRPILAQRGVNPGSILTVGSPYLEYYVSQPQPTEIKDTVLAANTGGKKIALVLLSGRGHTTSSAHHEAIIDLLNKVIAKKKNEYYFIFKLHKKDYADYYQRLYHDQNITGSFAIYTFDHFGGNESIFDWLSLSNLIITGASTTALEAMYLDKPVITIDLMHEYEHETPYIFNGGTYHCNNEEQLLNHLSELHASGFKMKQASIALKESYFSSSTVFHKFFSQELPLLAGNKK